MIGDLIAELTAHIELQQGDGPAPNLPTGENLRMLTAARDALLDGRANPRPQADAIQSIRRRIKRIDDALHQGSEVDGSPSQIAHREVHELAHEFEQMLGSKPK